VAHHAACRERPAGERARQSALAAACWLDSSDGEAAAGFGAMLGGLPMEHARKNDDEQALGGIYGRAMTQLVGGADDRRLPVAEARQGVHQLAADDPKGGLTPTRTKLFVSKRAGTQFEGRSVWYMVEIMTMARAHLCPRLYSRTSFPFKQAAQYWTPLMMYLTSISKGHGAEKLAG